MKNILAPANRDILEQFAWSNVLVALDYDGTLAPIVVEPDRAVMRSETKRLLAGLASHGSVAIISGRAQADIRARLKGVAVAAIVGNHGVEPHQSSKAFIAEVRRWRPLLEEATAPFKGVRIEDKTFSVAIHYRQSREKKKARKAILAVAAALDDVRVIRGKQVVNILPVGAPHKGIALERERDRLGCDTAIYVGDDETDEDVFMLDQPGRLLTIRVGARRASAAAYHVADQAAVDELLRTLVELRLRSQQLRSAAR